MIPNSSVKARVGKLCSIRARMQPNQERERECMISFSSENARVGKMCSIRARMQPNRSLDRGLKKERIETTFLTQACSQE